MNPLGNFFSKPAACAFAALAAFAAPSLAQFNNGNNLFVQQRNGPSVRGQSANFLGGNDRLLLLRNDDSAGLGNGPVTFGAANMGAGRDLVLTSFNASGIFRLGPGDDFFYSDGDVNFNGNALDIDVLGGPGNDIVGGDTDFCRYQGEEGNDFFFSTGNSNTFVGGPGSDTYSAELREAFVTISLSSGSGPDGLVGIENLRCSAFNDNILGDSNDNRIDGLEGNDIISALGGNDTVSGGPGVNTLDGGAGGIDTLVVEGTITSRSPIGPTGLSVSGVSNGQPFTHNANDFEQVLHNGVLMTRRSFLNQPSLDVVQQTVIPEANLIPTLQALVAGRTLNGNNNPNTINGGPGSDDIAGLGNNDILRGLAGDDEMFGGPGADRIRCGPGNDTAIGGPGADTLFGDLGDDNLNGGPGPDSLFGGAGSDIVNGGLGRDLLFGGPNPDRFVFASNFAGNDDAVRDYSVAEDTIVVSAALVGLPAGPLAAANFKNTASGPVDADDRLIYRSDNGRLFFDSNGSAPGGLVLIARLSPGLAMTEAEVLLQ